MGKEEQEPEVKVTDRRRFSAEGEALSGEEEAEREPESKSGLQAEEPVGEAAGPEQAEWQQRPPLPPPTFDVLVLSLRWQTELQLGLYGGEKDKEHAPDLEGAQHSIDLLGMLQEKTRGNLSLEEQRLLDNSLTELRFRYVQIVQELTQQK